MKIIVFRWKILYLFKLRHGAKRAVQLKQPAVVFATQVSGFAGLRNHQIAAVCAHVGKAMQGLFFIAREQQRLVEKVGQERERITTARFGNSRFITSEEPGLSKNFFLGRFKARRVGIKRRGQCLCHGNIVGYGKRFHPQLFAGRYRKVVTTCVRRIRGCFIQA